MKKNIALLLAVCIGSVVMVASVAVAIALVKNGVEGKLSTLEFVVEMAKAIAWPTTFVFFVTMFQESISDIVRKIQRVVLPGGTSIDIVQVIERTAEAAAALDSEQAAQAIPGGPANRDQAEPAPLSADSNLPQAAADLPPQETKIDEAARLSSKGQSERTPSTATSHEKIIVSESEEFDEHTEPRSLLTSHNPNVVLVAIASATRELWNAVLPDQQAPRSMTQRWQILKSSGALTDAEHQSLQALFVSRNKLNHAINGDDDRLTHAALAGFRNLAARMFILLTQRTSYYRKANSKE
ncbi:hypothetical protein ACIPLR_15745 [Herbaspirillum huttiense]|uniref:hypothetical protein n=1 Tax=Herbaspirillum huttiense TaxID=863372 RepID=UPI0037F7FC49